MRIICRTKNAVTPLIILQNDAAQAIYPEQLILFAMRELGVKLWDMPNDIHQ